MIPRLPHGRATVRLESGGEEPRAACAEDREPFDVLIDTSGGPDYRAAVLAARNICGRCPIQRTCLVENRREDWARAIITGKSVMQLRTGRRNDYAARRVA